MDTITRYFPDLTTHQQQQLAQLQPLYTDWNAKINVISRKDIDQLYTHHVLHSLAIAKVMRFVPQTKVLDLGTGGGFPGIPLAILFPEAQFKLVDSIGKKLKVAMGVAEAIGLKNVSVQHTRAEDMKERFDFVVSRAVADLGQLLAWSRKLIHHNHKNALPNGWFILKGGNVPVEIKALPGKEYTELTPVSQHFAEAYFQEKYVVYVQA
ncbi:MAG: 16S rRNA (guanine(527)-N(7))-methyltransferase RsmG [Saprospiraceae bacterium]